MRIAVVEDTASELRQISKFITDYFSQSHISCTTSVFQSPGDFLQSWRKERYDLLFLDIFFGNDPAGLKLAEQVRRDDKNCTIIFITSSADFALQGYGVRAMDYLLKPLHYVKFKETMDHFLASRPLPIPYYIEVKESRVMVKVALDDIYYTDYYNHYIQIHTPNRTIRTYLSFPDFLALLKPYPRFLCCYRNCIINMDKVTRLDKEEFVISNGERLPISRSMRASIQQQYADYQFSKLNGGF